VVDCKKEGKDKRVVLAIQNKKSPLQNILEKQVKRVKF
jgi:hypothetical protein